MNETGDVVFDSLSKFFGKLEEHNLEINLCIIILILLMMLISIITYFRQAVKAVKLFNAGVTDDKLVRLCVRMRKRHIFTHNAEVHDQFCCMLCSMYMERNEEALFFDNINDIKKITAQTEWRLSLVLVAYLTKQRYLDWSEKCRTTRIGEQPAADWLKTQDITYDADQLATADERITNTKVREVLKALTEEA